jgi:hypothetical protein
VPPAKLFVNAEMFFFSRKEAKALVLLRRSLCLTQLSAKPTQGSGGVPPAKLYVNPLSSLNSRKKQKRIYKGVLRTEQHKTETILEVGCNEAWQKLWPEYFVKFMVFFTFFSG